MFPGITGYSVHPGIVRSGLQDSNPGLSGAIIRFMINYVRVMTISPGDGARTTLYCATSGAAEKDAGKYFEPYGRVSKRADILLADKEVGMRLWDLSMKQLEKKT